MDPSAIRNLLLNLKLQLLALPSLARWGLLAFAGIVVLREVITIAWNAGHRRGIGDADPAAVVPGESADVPRTTLDDEGISRPALPAPSPFADPSYRRPERQEARIPTPPGGHPP